MQNIYLDNWLLNAARALDLALTDETCREKAWFHEQFEKDRQVYTKKIQPYLSQLKRGDITAQFPTGLNIHPLSLLLIRASDALSAKRYNKHYYYWRAYHTFMFWGNAICTMSNISGFRAHILHRLRNKTAFAGAMFETLVAHSFKATNIVSVEFSDDPPDLMLVKLGSKNETFAVECKMISGRTENQKLLGKICFAFLDSILGYLNRESLAFIVWWAFDKIPKDPLATGHARAAALDLCEQKKKTRSPAVLQRELGDYGRVIVADLPQELTLYDDETGDPRPSHWRPPGVPMNGEFCFDRRTQAVNGKLVVAARAAVHLTQNPAYQKGLKSNLDTARMQLNSAKGIASKKIVVLGLRNELPVRLQEAQVKISRYLAGHNDLSGIYLIVSPTSQYGASVVDCLDHSRVGLTAPHLEFIGLTRPGHDDDIPIHLLRLNKTRLACVFR